jgi:hypothetical protein
VIFLYLIACSIGFLINDLKGIAVAILVVGGFDLIKWAINGLMEENK